MKILNKKFSNIFLLVALFSFCNGCLGRERGINNNYTHGEIKGDTCTSTIYIRKTINEFISNKNENIYSSNFISSFKKINKYHNSCYFPNSIDEVKLYFNLGDSVLIDKAKKDERAMRLLINLYLINKNNAELSEYYGIHVIPKAASYNIANFIKILTEKSEREANKCIRKLQNIENASTLEKINTEINKINTEKYNTIIDKIREIIIK